jgi:hypothetical protein
MRKGGNKQKVGINLHGKMDTADVVLITQGTRGQFRVVAENKLHIPERRDLGAPLIWVFGVLG